MYTALHVAETRPFCNPPSATPPRRHAVGIQLAPLGPLFNPEHYTKLLVRGWA